MRIAAKVALDKQANPDKYCPTPRCLWKLTGNNQTCPRHGVKVIKDTRDGSKDYYMSLTKIKELVDQGKMYFDLTNGQWSEDDAQ